MDINYPKIDLESKEHLKFLEGYYKNELFSQIDSSDDSNDALKCLLNSYFNKTFSLVHPNIKINGQNYQDINLDDEVEFEQFDDKLRTQMSELDSNIEQLQNRLSEKRRIVPLELEELLSRQLRRQKPSNQDPNLEDEASPQEEDTDKRVEFHKEGLDDINNNINTLLSVRFTRIFAF